MAVIRGLALPDLKLACFLFAGQVDGEALLGTLSDFLRDHPQAVVWNSYNDLRLFTGNIGWPSIQRIAAMLGRLPVPRGRSAIVSRDPAQIFLARLAGVVMRHELRVFADPEAAFAWASGGAGLPEALAAPGWGEVPTADAGDQPDAAD